VLCGLAPTSWSAASLRRSPSSLPSPGAAPAPLSTAAASFVRRLPLPTKDLVVAPNAPTIYASVPSSAGAGGNSITPIDPVAGAAGTPIFVGSEPNRFAISDDGQTVYVGLDGEAGVRRFDVASRTAGLKFSLGANQDGPLTAEDIEVLPGQPDSVAVALRRDFVSPHHAGVAVYDGGVQRPTISDPTSQTNDIEFSASASTLYGLNEETTESGLRKLSVTSSGVTITATKAQLGAGPIEFSGGLIYHGAGRVVDPEAGTLVGTYSGMNFGQFVTALALCVDPASNRVYFLTESSSSATVWGFDKSTFALVGSFDVPNVSGRVGGLVRWGTNGLAFRDDNTVYLVQTDLVPSSDPVPTPTPTPGGSPSPTPTPSPIPTPAPSELRALALTTKDLVVDPNTQTIYASVPANAAASANSLITLDPTSGGVTASAPIGAGPNRLAISDDGQTVYVGLDGEQAVARYKVAAHTSDLKFPIGFGVAAGLSVMPGAAGTVAVSRREALSPATVAVYDDGVPRPVTVGTGGEGQSVAFSNSPEVLYVSELHTETGLGKLTVGPCGVGLAMEVPAVFGLNDSLKYDNGRIYAANGRVADAETGALAGTFVPAQLFPATPPAVATDSKAGRIYSLATDGSTPRLRVFDMQTFVLLGELSLPGVSGIPTSLVRWGSDGLAFRTDSQVFLLQNQLIAAPTPPPAFTPAPAATPLGFTLTGSVLFQATHPVPGVTLTYSGTRAGTAQTGADGTFTVPDLPLCGALTITPSKPFYTFNPPSLTVADAGATRRASFAAIHHTIGFDTSQQSPFEFGHVAFLNVVRTGDTDGTVSVTYQTHDGTASERSDYNAASGTLTFAPGESSKLITIPLTDDVFVEGPETFTATLSGLSDAQRYEMVTPTETVTILDNDTAQPTVSPLQDARFFVRQHYHDFLNRDPDADISGFNFWAGQLTACDAQTDPQLKAACLEDHRLNVSAAFFLSIEFQQTGFLVHRFYTASYPDSAARPKGLPRLTEFLRDTQEVQRGVVVGQGAWQQQLEDNKRAYALEFVQRPEFLARHPEGTPAGQFVDDLFANAGATPTTDERAAAVAAFGSGDTAGRAAALRSVAESKSVSDRQFNSAFVLMQYFGYLRRNPDDAPDGDFSGYQFWLDKLNHFGDFRRAEMVKAFLVSTEYQQRFGPTNFDIRR
jgi:sugar lactone lactonase YvrE